MKAHGTINERRCKLFYTAAYNIHKDTPDLAIE
jgi:hypothetical protein